MNRLATEEEEEEKTKRERRGIKKLATSES